jgi:hypothetical protein
MLCAVPQAVSAIDGGYPKHLVDHHAGLGC